MDYASTYDISFTSQFIDPSLLTSLVPTACSSSLGDSIDNTGFSDQNHQFKLDDLEQTIDGSEGNISYDSSLPDLSWSDHSAHSAVYPLPKELANSSYSASTYRPQAVVNGSCKVTPQHQEDVDTSFNVPSIFSSNLAAGPRQSPGMLSISRSQWTILIPMLDYCLIKRLTPMLPLRSLRSPLNLRYTLLTDCPNENIHSPRYRPRA